MLTDETNGSTSTSIESACLPIGCAVSAKYRGAFCSGMKLSPIPPILIEFFSSESQNSGSTGEAKSDFTQYW